MKPITNLVGIHGKFGSGKGAVARILGEEFGFEDWHFAEPVYESLYKLNPWVSDPAYEYDRVKRLRDIVVRDGWEYAKSFPDVRDYLQKIGTECGRDVFGEDCWVKQAEDKLVFDEGRRGTKPIAFSDLRFDNEAEMIHDYNGYNIHIIGPQRREGSEQNKHHISELGINPKLIDITIYNTGTLERLRELVVDAMTRPVTPGVFYGEQC